MHNWRVTVGIAVIAIGLIALIGALTGVNVWGLFCPAALILAGVALIARTRRIEPNTDFSFKLIGDIRWRSGEMPKSQEIWLGIADVDWSPAAEEIPPGETKLRLLGFVGDIDLRIPDGVGLSIASLAFLTEAKIPGDKTSNFVTPFEYTSPGYAEAERKIRLETIFFVADLTVRRQLPA